MSEYRPSRKVLAAAIVAVVGTVYLVATGEASLETLTALWAPVATAYGVSNG